MIDQHVDSDLCIVDGTLGERIHFNQGGEIAKPVADVISEIQGRDLIYALYQARSLSTLINELMYAAGNRKHRYRFQTQTGPSCQTARHMVVLLEFYFNVTSRAR